MKNTITIGILLLAIASAQAQNKCGPTKYMRQAMGNVIAKGIIYNNLASLGFHKGVCLIGTYLKEGKEVSFTTTLTAGISYAFVGGGDDDVMDLDIYLYNNLDEVVAKDSKTDNSPIVTYTPAQTGKYTVKIKMYATNTSGSFAGMVILSEHGYNIPISTLGVSLNDLFTVIEAACSKVSEISFLSTENQWALFGCVLEENTSTSISNIRLSSAKHNLIVGGGDQNALDVDLFLKNDSGITLHQDTKPDAHPVIICEGIENANYELHMKNAGSGDQRSLIMSAILEYR